MPQRLMRHSTPVLTANTYLKLELHDAREAVAKVDGLFGEWGAERGA